MLPIIGIALAASVALARDRLPPWLDLAIATVFASVPLAAFARTPSEQSTARTMGEWSAAGGPVVQAAYQVDALALVGAAVVAIITGAALHGVARVSTAAPLLRALIAIDGIALVVLVSVTDVVFGVLLAGGVAVLAVATALFVATPAAAARLAALLAMGVEALSAAALLLARHGIAGFDLARVPPEAVGPGVLAATVLGAALFCGLYPFVPWRYEPRAEAAPLGALRGLALFPIGVAGSVLALRLIVASGTPAARLRLPDVELPAQLVFIGVIAGLSAIAAFAGPAEARRRRLLTGGAFLIAVAALPVLRLSHVIALLALLTVLYAAVASAAVLEEWDVARFDVRLGTLWAAIASGATLSLGGALFGLVASAVAVALERAAAPTGTHVGIATSARVLAVFGPFVALAGVATSTDPVLGVLAAITFATAGALELAHAVRADRYAAQARGRAYATLAALAVTAVVTVLALEPVLRATTHAFAADAAWGDALLIALPLLLIALTVVVVSLPQLVRMRVSPGLLVMVRRALAATDPAPALALAYRGLEVWSRRAGAASAALEERAGVWVATALLALSLLWAASS